VIGSTTGCLLGGAVGDALGAPVEFLRLHRDRPPEAGVGDVREGGHQILVRVAGRSKLPAQPACPASFTGKGVSI